MVETVQDILLTLNRTTCFLQCFIKLLKMCNGPKFVKVFNFSFCLPTFHHTEQTYSVRQTQRWVSKAKTRDDIFNPVLLALLHPSVSQTIQQMTTRACRREDRSDVVCCIYTVRLTESICASKKCWVQVCHSPLYIYILITAAYWLRCIHITTTAVAQIQRQTLIARHPPSLLTVPIIKAEQASRKCIYVFCHWCEACPNNSIRHWTPQIETVFFYENKKPWNE